MDNFLINLLLGLLIVICMHTIILLISLLWKGMAQTKYMFNILLKAYLIGIPVTVLIIVITPMLLSAKPAISILQSASLFLGSTLVGYLIFYKTKKAARLLFLWSCF